MSAADELLAHLAAALVPYLKPLLAEDVRPTHYSTEPGCWPPRAKSRRHARDLIRRVDGAEQVGQGRTTQWRVSVVAFDACYTKPVKPTLQVVPALSDEALADRAIAASGLRSTRKSA